MPSSLVIGDTVAKRQRQMGVVELRFSGETDNKQVNKYMNGMTLRSDKRYEETREG